MAGAGRTETNEQIPITLPTKCPIAAIFSNDWISHFFSITVKKTSSFPVYCIPHLTGVGSGTKHYAPTLLDITSAFLKFMDCYLDPSCPYYDPGLFLFLEITPDDLFMT